MAPVLAVLALGPSAEAGTGDLWDTRISVQDECPITGKEQLSSERIVLPMLATAAVSLFNALLPKAIDVGLSYAAGEAKKAARADNSVSEVSGLGLLDGFYQLSKSGDDKPLEVTALLANKCIVIARGLYGSDDTPATFENKPWKDKATEDRLLKLGLRRDPGIYLEARIRVSPDGTHFRVEPIRFFFGRALHDGTPPAQEFDLTLEFKFQSPSGDTGGATFALGNLVLRSVVKGEYLREEALKVSSSGWMPILAQTPDIVAVQTKVAGLYTQREVLTKEIADSEQDVKRLADEWSQLPGVAGEGDPRKLFEAVMTQAQTDLAQDKYDDDYFTALLNAPAAAAEGQDGTAEAAPAGELEKAKKRLDRNREKQTLITSKEKGQWGLNQLALIDAKRAELAAVEGQIAILERDRPLFSPVNIVVTIKEQNSKPENKFLMTAAEILEGSSEGIKNTLLANLTPEGREQLRKQQQAQLGAQADLVIAAMEARKVAEERAIALKGLKAGASEVEILNAKHAVETARIQANMAARNAGLSPPYPSVFGGTP